MTEDKMVEWHHDAMDMSLSKLWELMMDREAWLEKKMATHSSALAWRIPGTAEPGGLPSMGSHRVGHNRRDLAAAAAAAAKPGVLQSMGLQGIRQD